MKRILFVGVVLLSLATGNAQGHTNGGEYTFSNTQNTWGSTMPQPALVEDLNGEVTGYAPSCAGIPFYACIGGNLQAYVAVVGYDHLHYSAGWDIFDTRPGGIAIRVVAEGYADEMDENRGQQWVDRLTPYNHKVCNYMDSQSHPGTLHGENDADAHRCWELGSWLNTCPSVCTDLFEVGFKVHFRQNGDWVPVGSDKNWLLDVIWLDPNTFDGGASLQADVSILDWQKDNAFVSTSSSFWRIVSEGGLSDDVTINHNPLISSIRVGTTVDAEGNAYWDVSSDEGHPIFVKWTEHETYYAWDVYEFRS